MAAVSRAFQAVPDRAGLVVGIAPCGDDPALPRPGYPNPYVELAILTHLPLSGASGTEPLSRNHINVLSSNVLIALPGGPGTASEVELALRYRRPIAAFLDRRTDIPGLPDQVPVLATLKDVAEFVRRNLGEA
jgi:predicted Rossmann-fold nucleotide-binding protein